MTDTSASARPSACIHNILDGKVNEFIFTEVSRRALVEMFHLLEEIQIEAVRNNPADHANPYLIDSTLGMQPLNYAFTQMRSLVNQYPAMRGSPFS